MQNNETILVFGLPGAGKTTLINEVLNVKENYVRLSGGSLIQGNLSEEERDQLRKTSKDGVLDNQEILVMNFIKAKQSFLNKTVIFDGHCVVKNEEQIVEIPLDVIKRLEPDLILFIDETSEVIMDRRKKDKSRPDREEEDKVSLDKNRQLQLKICEQYATSLNIGFESLLSPSVEMFIEAADLCAPHRRDT